MFPNDGNHPGQLPERQPPGIGDNVPLKFNPEEILSLLESGEGLFKDHNQSILSLIPEPQAVPGARESSNVRIEKEKLQYKEISDSIKLAKQPNYAEIIANLSNMALVPYVGQSQLSPNNAMQIFINNSNPLLIKYAKTKLNKSNVVCENELNKQRSFNRIMNEAYMKLVETQLEHLMLDIYTLLSDNKMTLKDETLLVKEIFDPLMNAIIKFFISSFKDEDINTPSSSLLLKLINHLYPLAEYYQVSRYIVICLSNLVKFLLNNFDNYQREETKDFVFDVTRVFALSIPTVIGGGKLRECQTEYKWLINIAVHDEQFQSREINGDIQKFIDNDENEKMEMFYSIFGQQFSKKLSDDAKTADRIVLMAFAYKAGIQEEVFNYDGGERSKPLKAALAEMKKINLKARQSHLDYSEIMNKAIVILKTSSEVEITNNDISKFILSNESYEEIISSGNVDKMQCCFEAINQTKSFLSEYSKKDFFSQVSAIFTSAFADSQSFESLAEIIQYFDVDERKKKQIIDFFDAIFNLMKTTNDSSILRLVYKFCKSIDIPEVNDYIFNRMNQEEEGDSKLQYPFFAIKYIMIDRMVSVPNCFVENINKQSYNLIFIRKLSQTTLNDYDRDLLFTRISSMVDDMESPHLRVVCDIISNLFVHNEWNDDESRVVSYIQHLIKKIGSSMNSHNFSYASELIRIIRKVLMSNNIHRESIKQFMSNKSDDVNVATGIIAVIGMYSESYSDKQIAHVVGADSMAYIDYKGVLYNYPIPPSNKKIPCKSVKVHIEPEDFLPFDMYFFNILVNYKNCFETSSFGVVFNLVFAQAYSYYMRFKNTHRFVVNNTDKYALYIDIEKMVDLNGISDKIETPKPSSIQQIGNQHYMLFNGTFSYVTDPINLNKEEINLLFSPKYTQVGVSFVIPSCEQDYEYFSKTIYIPFVPNQALRIRIDMKENKMFIGDAEPLNIPESSRCMHLIFTDNVEITDLDNAFEKDLIWDYHHPRSYTEDKPDILKFSRVCNRIHAKLNIKRLPPENVHYETLIPNASGDNVSNGLKEIYNKSIIKKRTAQWITVIAAQYVDVFGVHECNGLFLMILRVLLFSFYPSSSTFTAPWENTSRICGLPYGLDLIVAKALHVLSDNLDFCFTDLCKAMCRTPENFRPQQQFIMDSPFEICQLLKFTALKQLNDSQVSDVLQCFMDICIITSNKNMFNDFISIFKGNYIFYRRLLDEYYAFYDDSRTDDKIAFLLLNLINSAYQEVTLNTKVRPINRCIQYITNEEVTRLFSLVYKFGCRCTNKDDIPCYDALDLWGSATDFLNNTYKNMQPKYRFRSGVYRIDNPYKLTLTIYLCPNNNGQSSYDVFVGDDIAYLNHKRIGRYNNSVRTSSEVYYISTCEHDLQEEPFKIKIEYTRIQGKSMPLGSIDNLFQFKRDVREFATEWGIEESYVMREELENKTFNDISSWISNTELRDRYSQTVLSMRAQLFFLLNDLVPIYKNDPQLVKIFRLYPHLFSKKSTFTMISCEAISQANNVDRVKVVLNRKKAQDLIDGKSSNVEDSLIQQISKERKNGVLGNKLFFVRYEGEKGIDSGGLTKDAINQAFVSFFHPSSKLVEPCYNLKCNSKKSNFYLPITKLEKTESLANVYSTFGQLLAAILLQENRQNIPFPPLVWKLLIDRETNITIDDIKSIDANFCLRNTRWTCFNWFGEEMLLPGHTIDEAFFDKEQYESECVKFRVMDLMFFIDNMRKGFKSVYKDIKLFGDWQTIRDALHSDSIDIDVLIKSLHFGGIVGERLETYKNMFTNIIKTFSQNELKLLLTFTTGTPFIPIFSSVFKFSVDFSGNVGKLPVAHTCSNKIEIPMYGSQEEMSRKILYAISNCEGMEIE